MGMVVRSNIMAMNANRQLGINNSAVGKSLEKLSSGFRINRAADDASGLAISEKMKAQIKGLETASANSQDGISLIQTAEGGAQEIHDMLNRMTELATKSANGTIQNEVDREAIQKEVDDLNEEITRIAKSTNFNGINLLDGNLAGGAATGGSSSSGGALVATVNSTIAALKTGQADAAATKGKYAVDLSGIKGATASAATNSFKFTVEYIDTDGKKQSKTLDSGAMGAGDTAAIMADAIEAAINNDADLNKLFTATSTTGADFALEAKQAGTNGAQFVGLKVEGAVVTATGAAATGITVPTEVKAKATTVATDATTKDVIDMSGTIAAKSKITVGDKTYEFVASGGDVTSVEKGNVAVVMGADHDASVANLVKALNANGVTSARVDSDGAANTGDDIKIGNLDEIKAADKKANIATTSNGVKVSTVSAEKGQFKFDVGAAAVDGSSQTLTLTYMDEAGKEQTRKVSYTADATIDDNAAAIKAAIEADDELSKIFTVGAYAANDNALTIEAKNAGSSGAKLTGISTTDINAGSVGGLQTTKAGRDAGQTISIDSSKISKGETMTINGKTFEFADADNMDNVGKGNIAVLIDSSSNANTAANLNLAMKNNGVNAEFNSATNSFFVADGADVKIGSGGGLTLQIGDTGDDFNRVTVSVDDLSAAGIGTAGINVGDQDNANGAIKTIKSAINKVSTNRANLGSLQNRLEHTINNLDTTAENMTAANSRIRDTDMAKEMMNYTKMNVLQQAAQAMLAQANQAPQSILQLLQ